MSDTPLALFVGMPGPVLTANEFAFLRDANPFGLFIFRRNIETETQVRVLVARFREAVGRDDAPVYVDQEGGRVQRFADVPTGNWPKFRALGDFGALALIDEADAHEALRLSSLAMGAMLSGMGVGSGTTPVLDLALAGKHDVIGRRAFGSDPALVARLGRTAVEALLEVGSMPIVKHIPGYGRVEVDPHFHCPRVETDRDTLFASDFRPFIDLADAPWAMVAHLVFDAIDPERPASVSPLVHDLIRTEIGYDGVIITDCLTMEALSGTHPERVAACLAAGYDIALHSQGTLADQQAAAAAARPLTEKSLERLNRARAKLGDRTVSTEALCAEVESIFARHGMA